MNQKIKTTNPDLGANPKADEQEVSKNAPAAKMPKPQDKMTAQQHNAFPKGRW